MPPIGTIDNLKVQSLVNTAAVVGLPNGVFPSRSTNIIIQQNNCVVSRVIVFAVFLECLAQLYKLCSIESPSNGIVRFEQLIIDDPMLFPPNARVFFHEYSHGTEFPCFLIIVNDFNDVKLPGQSILI